MKFKALPLAVYLCRCLLLVAVLFFLSEEDVSAALPAGFVMSEVGSGWQEAVGITFDEANRMYVWERPGKVWIVENGVKSATPLIDISQEVSTWNDLGLLGVALDPKFRLNGYIYLYYVVDHHYLQYFGTPQYDPAANDFFRATIGRLTRYTAVAANDFRSVDPASRRILIGETISTGIPVTYNTHSVGTLLFGTDGTLLASSGDGAGLSDGGSDPSSYFSLALSEGILKPKENVGAFRSQMVDSHNGKILRIDPATGDGVPSNPFYDPANPRSPRSRVYALGLRNPFRISLKPGTGSHVQSDGNPGVLYVGDVGYFTWEEVDVVTAPGQNFGWPVFEGFEQFGPSYESLNPPNPDAPNPLFGSGGCTQQFFTFRDLLKEATLGTPSWPNPCNASQQVPNSIPHFSHKRPAIDWKHGSGPSRAGTFVGNNAAIVDIGAPGSPVSGPQFGGACSIGGVWYNASQFPAQYLNTYFFTDWVSGWFRYMTFDSNNVPVSVNDFGSGMDGMVAMIVHPVSGELYVVNIGAGVQKITYGGNAAPKAVANANVRFGTAPLAVQFNGSASSDPEGQALTYRWDFGDGSPVSTQANPTHTFNAPAGVPTRYDVTLTVTDTGGATNAATMVISPNNTPPAVTITSPIDGSLYPITGDTLYPLTALVSDTEHSLAELSPAWQVILHHNTHTHPNPVDTNWTSTAVTSPLGCGTETYYYRIIFTVTDAAGLSTTKEAFLYPDCNTNTPPVISNIADQTLNGGQSTGALPFTIGDAQTAANSLTLGKTSSNQTLIPLANIVFGGSGSNRTVTITPAAGQTGTATIGVSVSDGTYTVTDNFVVSVFPANNTAPTISSIPNQVIDEDTSTGAIGFTINDAESGAGNLSLSRGSSNPALVPTSNIVLAGTGQNRTVTVTPVANLSGSATITVTVTDGQFSSSTNFVVTVNPVNDPPIISNIADQTTSLNVSTGPLSFTVDDLETAAGSLTLSADSSNLTLLPLSNIIFGGSGANRIVTLIPAADQTGTATVTVRVSDGSLNATDTFLLTVNTAIIGTRSFTNGATITVPDVGAATPYPSLINVNGLGGTVSQVIVNLNGIEQTWPGDFDVMLVGPTGQKVMLMSDVGGGTPVTGVNLTLSDAAAGNLPQTPVLVSGTFKPTDYDPTNDPFPAPGPTGAYATNLAAFNTLNPNGAWSLYVVDDGAGDSGQFAGGWSLTITTTSGTPTASPTISDIPDESTAVNTATGPIPFTIADSDTPVATLTLSGGSSNPTLVPTANIVFGGSGSNRTVTVTPAASQSGTATITVTVSDGVNTASDSFVLTVQPPNNTAPTISSIADQTINEDTSTGPLSFTIGDAETSAASLVLSRASSNTTLVPTNNIVFGGSSANRLSLIHI